MINGSSMTDSEGEDEEEQGKVIQEREIYFVY
jgi:hypothetical protein